MNRLIKKFDEITNRDGYYEEALNELSIEALCEIADSLVRYCENEAAHAYYGLGRFNINDVRRVMSGNATCNDILREISEDRRDKLILKDLENVEFNGKIYGITELKKILKEYEEKENENDE